MVRGQATAGGCQLLQEPCSEQACVCLFGCNRDCSSVCHTPTLRGSRHHHHNHHPPPPYPSPCPCATRPPLGGGSSTGTLRARFNKYIAELRALVGPVEEGGRKMSLFAELQLKGFSLYYRWGKDGRAIERFNRSLMKTLEGGPSKVHGWSRCCSWYTEWLLVVDLQAGTCVWM